MRNVCRNGNREGENSIFMCSGILWRPLRCGLAHNTKILKVCAKLHNFCIDENVPDHADGFTYAERCRVGHSGNANCPLKLNEQTGCPVNRVNVVKRKGRKPDRTVMQRCMPDVLFNALSVDARTRLIVAYCERHGITRPAWATRKRVEKDSVVDTSAEQSEREGKSGSESE